MAKRGTRRSAGDPSVGVPARLHSYGNWVSPGSALTRVPRQAIDNRISAQSARWAFAPVCTADSAPLLRHPVGVKLTEIHILVRQRVQEGRPHEWLGRFHDHDGARVAGLVEAAPEMHP